MSIYSVGLSTTGHDPAFAIVSPDGEVVFAEATERFLQSKRAWGALPDQLSHVKPVLGEIIRNDPSAEFQISLSWSGKKMIFQSPKKARSLPLICWSGWLRFKPIYSKYQVPIYGLLEVSR